MEPNALSAQPKLPNFSGKKGSSPTFQEYQLKLIALCREKFIHEALLPIGEDLNAAKTLIYQKADNGVYNAIITSISGEALIFASQHFPVKEDTPSDAYLGQKLYQGLKERFAADLKPQEIFNLEMKIFGAKCGEKTVTSYVQYIENARFNFITKTHLDDENTISLDKKIVQLILNGLPKSYQTFTFLQRALEEPPELQDLIQAIEIQERTHASAGEVRDESPLGFAAAARGKRGGYARGNRGRGGHHASQRGSHASTKTGKPFYPLNGNQYLQYSNFVLDSAATQSSTYNIDDLDHDSVKPCSEIIISADDSEMKCSEKGDLNITLDDQGTPIHLKDVRVIPSSNLKLISLEHLLSQGYQIKSKSSDTLILTCLKGPTIEFRIPPNGPRLYRLIHKSSKFCLANKSKEKKTPLSQEEFAYQHFKLGHINNQDLATILRKAGNTISNNTMKGFICEHCELSKSTVKHPIDRKESIASGDTKHPGDWIHSDLNGPEMSYNTTKYVMNFVDEISGLISIELLDNKGQVPLALEQFIQKCRSSTLKLQIGENTTFHSDGDQVYKSEKMRALCAKENIFQSFSPSYHPERNGKAERQWRTLFGDARTTISSAAQISNTIIDSTHWPLAISHATLVRNLTPRGNSEKSAYEIITGKNPHDIISILQPFGTPCFVHDSSPTVQKLDDKAFKAFYVGYDLESKSHKVLNPITKMVLTTVNLTFDVSPFNSKLLLQSVPKPIMPKVPRQYNKKSKSIAEANIENTPVTIPSSAILNNDIKTDTINNNDVSVEPAVSVSKLIDEKTPEINNIPAVKPTVIPEQTKRPNTRSQHAASALNEGYRESKPESEPIPTITPTSAKKAINGDFSQQWSDSMLREANSLFENNVFEKATDIPIDAKILPSMFTFRIKDEPEIEYKKRFKARLVVLGNHQIPGIHYNEDELSSPVLKASSFRALTAKAVDEGWTMDHIDVNSAFCNTPLKEVIYMKLPQELVDLGFPSVVKLLKNLYGLHQAPKGWCDLVTTWIVEDYGCKQLISDQCLFSHPTIPIYIGLFVDDFDIAGTDEAKNNFRIALSKRFKISFKGQTKKYIGVNVDQTITGRITLSQTDYIKSILQMSNMLNCHPTITPAVPKTVLSAAPDSDDNASVQNFPYSKVVGQLLWISVMTKPEIAYQVGQLAKYVSNFGKIHVDAAKYCLRYLKGSMHTGIQYTKTTEPATIDIFSDATWANDQDMKSVSGNAFILLGGAISWRAKTQSSIAVSFCDSE